MFIFAAQNRKINSQSEEWNMRIAPTFSERINRSAQICRFVPLGQRVSWSICIPLILLVLSACNTNLNKNDLLMKHAERQMRIDTHSAMIIIDSIPNSLLCQDAAPEWHNKRCLQVFRYNKAAICVQEEKWEAAKDWMCLIIMQDDSNEGKKQAIDLFEKLVLLSNHSKENDDIKDSLKNLLVSQLLSNDTCFKHYYASNYSSAIKDTTIHSPIYWTAIIFLIICISLLLFKQQKENKEIKLFQYQNRIIQLNKNAERMRECMSEKLGIGKQIYETVKNGGTMKNISIENEHFFIDYYAFLFPHEYATITKPYTNLSLRHTTYLILRQMGFNDTDIKTILFVKPSTIRNYRLRIAKKRQIGIIK